MSPHDLVPDLVPTSSPGASETTSSLVPYPEGDEVGQHLVPQPRPEHLNGRALTSTCAHCGESFERKARGRPGKFCSGACRVAAWRGAKRDNLVLTVAELARRLGIEPEAAAADLAYFERAGLAERVNGGYRPTSRCVELGLALHDEARKRDVPLTQEDLRALTSRTGPRPGVRRRELTAA
jgi:hypothetical protein